MGRKSKIEKLIFYFEKTKYTLGKKHIDRIHHAVMMLDHFNWNVDKAVSDWNEGMNDFLNPPPRKTSNNSIENTPNH